MIPWFMKYYYDKKNKVEALDLAISTKRIKLKSKVHFYENCRN
jgi:hypothetical protein